MSLYGYKLKGKANIAMAAFPGQFAPRSATVKRAVRKVSKARSQRLKDYAMLRDQWLAIHPTCEVCGEIMPRHIRQLHHKRGRVGKLLIDDRYWCAVHPHCHTWIHNNPGQAMIIGALCGLGDWGKQL